MKATMPSATRLAGHWPVRPNPAIRFLTFSFLFSLFFFSGCAPAGLKANPPGWPTEWRERQLYHTPHAYIYASSGAAAWEADELVHRAANEFERRGGTRPATAFIIVNDVNDPPVIENLDQLFKFSNMQTAPSSAPAASEQRSEKIAAAMAEMGVEVEVDLMMRTLPLRKPDLEGLLGFPPEVTQTGNWAISLPTRRVVEEASRRMMQSQLEKRDIGLLLQVAMAPITSIQEFRMVNVACVGREIALFTEWSHRQESWPIEQQAEKIDQYTQRKLQEVNRPLTTLLEDSFEVVTTPVKWAVEPFQNNGDKDEAKGE
ncbi:MAG: hypothetical protein HJJLKODD_00585 [Phycisphaerae bacterium]|nr:hypothetical protein [Phycisphaerae bacterium]